MIHANVLTNYKMYTSDHFLLWNWNVYPQFLYLMNALEYFYTFP